MATEVMVENKINCRRLPGGYFATITKTKDNRYEVRVFNSIGNTLHVETCLTYDIANAVAHREAWAMHVSFLTFQETGA